MPKIIRLFHLICYLFTFNQTNLSAQLNFAELNASVKELTEYLKINTIENTTSQTNTIEEIDFYLRLIEKAQKDPLAAKTTQKLFNQLHKHLTLLIKPAFFEQNYYDAADFLEELFDCKINDNSPFKYSLAYAFLAISRIYEIQKQNEYVSKEQLYCLRDKIKQNFKNAFNDEKYNLEKQYPNITKNKINIFFQIIEKSIPIEKTSFNWNWNEIIKTSCFVGISITLIMLLYTAIQFIKKNPNSQLMPLAEGLLNIVGPAGPTNVLKRSSELLTDIKPTIKMLEKLLNMLLKEFGDEDESTEQISSHNSLIYSSATPVITQVPESTEASSSPKKQESIDHHIPSNEKAEE